jgi:hypothetical protein
MTLSRYEQILAHVESFALELDQLVRQSVMELVEQALAQSIRDSGSAQGTGRARAGKGRTGAQPTRPAATANTSKGGRRTGAELEELTQSLLKYIHKHPGSRMEQVAKGMDIPSKELNLPLGKLKAEGRLKTKGQKRATSYFAK